MPGQIAGEEAQQVVGYDGHGEIEEGELLGNGQLDEPAASIAAENVGEAGFQVVCDQEGGTAVGAV